MRGSLVPSTSGLRSLKHSPAVTPQMSPGKRVPGLAPLVYCLHWTVEDVKPIYSIGNEESRPKTCLCVCALVHVHV